MDKQTYEQLDRMEGLLREIAYEIGIFDETGNYVKREQRDEEEIETTNKIKTSVKDKKTGFEDEEEYNEEDE